MKHRHVRNQRGQLALIGSLVAIAVLIIFAVWYTTKALKAVSIPEVNGGAAMTPIEQANNVACESYRGQIREAEMQYRQDNDGKRPTSWDDLRKYGVTQDMVDSPGCNFQLDAGGGHHGDQGGGQTGGQGGWQNGEPPGVSPTGAAPSAAPAPSGGQGQHNWPGGGTQGPGGITIPNIPGSSPG